MQCGERGNTSRRNYGGEMIEKGEICGEEEQEGE
jgi:hypothetical protein